MARLPADAFGTAVQRGRQVSRHVARRDSSQAQHADSEMREILAYAGADAENLVGGRLYFRLARFVGELRMDVSDYSIGVVSYIFRVARSGHPEEFSQRLTERYVPAGAQKIALSLGA